MIDLLGKIFDSASLKNGNYKYLVGIVDFLDMVIIPVTVTLAVAAGLMGVIITVALAKAETPEKIAEMKKRLMGLFITVFIVLVLVWVLGFILSNFNEIADGFRSVFNFSQGSGEPTAIFRVFKL